MAASRSMAQEQQIAPKKGTGVLRSILPKDHKRTKSQSDVLSSRQQVQTVPLLPADHPHSRPYSPEEDRAGRQARKENVAPHKRSKSTVSLRSLGKSRDSDKTKERERKDRKEKKAQQDESGSRMKPKKTKSSTSLAGMFARMNRSTKDLSQAQHDKENMTPSSATSETVATPIWAQFASPSLSGSDGARQVKHGDYFDAPQQRIEDEIARYTPQDYSPSKQRNFAAYGPPNLSRPPSSARPKSALIAGSTSFMDSLSRTISGDRPSSSRSSKEEPLRSSTEHLSRDANKYPDRKVSASSNEQAPATQGLTIAKRGARVMAAVAALNGKANANLVTKNEPALDATAVDAAFEAVLDSRNIPENMRQKMRALTLRVKADFVRQDKGISTPNSPSKHDSKPSFWPEDSPEKDTRQNAPETDEGDTNATKRSRPRSKTFNFNKGESSPPKKQKAESRPTSIHIPAASPTKAVASPVVPSHSASPDDFVAYLQKFRDPTQVEVGRLHKLRLLLRNETVAWVDSFISLGGMAEIVDLLNRIMAIEWREEHEDQLLHEALLCLKGLCTTEVALKRLDGIADTLFPSLLGMIFDEEKKGPSEFNTRGVIINILFAYLSAASAWKPDMLADRARKVLGYLIDPKKPEEAQPIPFVLDMRQSRPYRVWCNEVSNVSREVFWIFLHHLNVVPLEKQEEPSHGGQSDRATVENPPEEAYAVGSVNTDLKGSMCPAKSYTKRHFPGDRPPVPAAPYIGGVEWDATTYMTAHLDLLNGLIASLPGQAERNKLRTELKASGWEKLLGGTLRTCKEKFYCGVHSGLRSWVAAAQEDGWCVEYVRFGPSQEELAAASPKKSPKKSEPPPRLDAPEVQLPRLDLGLGGMDSTGGRKDTIVDDGWLL
ncbi:hypothetical protein MBLNU459_g1052t1 [Dothideomycetes sp. NU459]